MSRRFAALVALAAGLAMAQTNPNDRPTATIRGVVRDKLTKQPLANFKVSTTGDRQMTTDASGKYTLSGLPPGGYQINVQAAERFLSQVTRAVTVSSQDLENIDFDVPIDATISGKVVDENGEPVSGVSVRLITREYYLGTAGYFYAFPSGATDDRGQYSIKEIPPGRPYLLVVSPAPAHIPAHSEVPVNPNFRKRVPMRTWYPNSPDREGAVPLVMRPGEHRDAVDIQVKRSPNYCVEGTTTSPNGPVPMYFEIEALQPSSGTNSTGGSYTGAPHGTTSSDGKLRICDLTPGQYRVEIHTDSSHEETVAGFGVTYLLVKDEDQRGLKFMTTPGQTLEAEVVWDTAPAGTVPRVKLSLNFEPTLRTGFPGLADWDGKDIEIPGTVSFENLFLDDYEPQMRLRGKGLYIKDVTYGGQSILHERLHYGSAMQGSGLRIVVARDGGTLAARVADKDSKPLADAHVVFFPVDAGSEGIMAATMTNCLTDQLGQCTSKTLRPGSYYVLASDEEFDASIESIAKLWRSRTTLQKVELAPKASADVKLDLATLM